MTPILNHVISFANVPDIDSYLERYKKAGFVVDEKTVRHEPGNRNGFVYFGPEYIEFFWIEDKKAFNKKAKAYAKEFSKKPRPFGIAFDSQSAETFHNASLHAGFRLKSVRHKAMSGATDTLPWWAFQDVPLRYLPGAWTFILTYLRRDYAKPRTARIGKNTIYGISGITFITAMPHRRALQWQKFLGAKEGRVEKTRLGSQYVHGPHVLEWVSPKKYSEAYGAIQSPITSKKFKNMQEIALIHLVASDARKARMMLQKNGFKTEGDGSGFFIKPDLRDGFAFHVSQEKPIAWAEGRVDYGRLDFVN